MKYIPGELNVIYRLIEDSDDVGTVSYSVKRITISTSETERFGYFRIHHKEILHINNEKGLDEEEGKEIGEEKDNEEESNEKGMKRYNSITKSNETPQ